MNYLGRYIAESIRAIPAEEVEESKREGFPAVLVIGPGQYVRQIETLLREQEFNVEAKEQREPSKPCREDGLAILSQDEASNLGWRILLANDRPRFLREAIRRSVEDRTPLARLLSDEYREQILEEMRQWREVEANKRMDEGATPAPPQEGPTIRCTTFEGSKGLSAQHVFVVGLQEGELPRDRRNIRDLEICRLIVALTRTRKECHLMYTKFFSGKPKRSSLFLNWICYERLQRVRVDKTYWTSRGK